MSFESNVSRSRGIAGMYSKSDFNLLIRGIGLLRVGNRRAIILVVLHQAPDIRERCLDFLGSERFAHLQLRGVHDLRFRRTSGSTFNIDLAYKKNRSAGKCKYKVSVC